MPSPWAGGCELRRIGHLGYMLLQVPVAFKRHPSTHGFARSDQNVQKLKSLRLELLNIIAMLSIRDVNALHDLTLHAREHGGRLVPSMVNDHCVLRSDTNVTVGTAMARDIRGRYAMVQNVPFNAEIYARSHWCNTPSYGLNVVWHTHPLHIVDGYVRFAPPSVEDYAIHTVLGNMRQTCVNGFMNTYITVAREGFYVYGIRESTLDAIWGVLDDFDGKLDPPTRVRRDVDAIVANLLVDAYREFEAEAFGFCRHMRLQTQRDLDTRLRDPRFRGSLSEFINDSSYAAAIERAGFVFQFTPYGEPVSVNVA